jgi:hypothetical protein
MKKCLHFLQNTNAAGEQRPTLDKTGLDQKRPVG